MPRSKWKRLSGALQGVAGVLIVAYALYVAAVAVFLNTPLFAKVASMVEDDQTYVRFKGAYSLYPGHLYAPSARVFIGDHNVSIGIDVSEVRARFRLRPLLDKRLEVRWLRIGVAEVDVGLKSEQQRAAYLSKYAHPADLDLKRRLALAAERAKTRLTLDFQKIVIDRLRNVRGAFGRIEGEMALNGGFLIQPKVQVEVYPSTLYFLSGIVGRADVRFERFQIAETPGNAVWPYVHADLDFNINTERLKRLDFRLDNLPGYSLDGVGSNGSVKVRIVKGQLQKGSVIESLPSRLTLRTPGLDANGFGRLRWTVDAPDSSRARVTLSQLRLVEKKSGGINRGRLRSLEMDLRLFGNGLTSAFNGLSAQLGLRGLDWKILSPAGQDRNFSYSGRLTGGGKLAAFTGEVPARARRDTRRVTRLELQVPDLRLKTSFAGEIRGRGKVILSANAIDLGINAARFPEMTADLDLELPRYGNVSTRAIFSRLEHQLSPEDTWKGRFTWTFDRSDPIVELLRPKADLSPVVWSLAKVRDLVLDADCEMSDELTWLRFSRIRSSGVWKGYGTLRNDERGLSGLFELSVLTVPVGLSIQPERTEVKFMPDTAWYDQALLPTILPPVEKPSRMPLGENAQNKTGKAF